MCRVWYFMPLIYIYIYIYIYMVLFDVTETHLHTSTKIKTQLNPCDDQACQRLIQETLRTITP